MSDAERPAFKAVLWIYPAGGPVRGGSQNIRCRDAGARDMRGPEAGELEIDDGQIDAGQIEDDLTDDGGLADVTDWLSGAQRRQMPRDEVLFQRAPAPEANPEEEEDSAEDPSPAALTDTGTDAGDPAAIAPQEEPQSEPAKPVLLLFSDDSTLFFCLRMKAELLRAEPDRVVELVWYLGETALSYRQMAQLLPEGPDRSIGPKQLAGLAKSSRIGAIITSRVYRPLGDVIKPARFRLGANRPCIIAFLGGLDFFPQNGFMRRRNCDGVYLFPTSGIRDYEQAATAWDDSWQDVGFGHPSFLRPEGPPDDLAERRDVYFFTQALSPSTRRGRIHVLRAMAAIARANPDRTIWIKLRHLPNENQKHLHLERFDYPGLMKTMPDLPENLKLTACLMDEALQTAAIGITCSSTAAIDVVRAGIPSMVYLDFVDNYRDPLVEPMRALFQSSGLITSLEDMLHLRCQPPNPAWIDEMLCPRNLGERVFDTIRRFETRPFQLTEKIA